MTEPPRGAQPPAREHAALSRELGEFLIELSIALNKHAMYPAGHPSLMPAADGVVHRLKTLLEQRGTLSLGVARNQLVIEGVATDPRHPVLADLAARLHRHHLGAVSFQPGVTGKEVHDVLCLVAQEADRTGDPLGVGPPERLAAWPHVRLYPMTYERLELVGEGDEKPGEGDEERGGEARTRAAQLWIGLARAALAGEELGTDLGKGGDAEDDTDPRVVAQAIEAHRRGSAYDQVIVGYLLQMADEMRASGTGETLELRQRLSALISTLDPQTLERLLEMGGDRAQRRQFVLNASQTVAVQAVVDLVRAAGAAEGDQTISHSMLRMLRKLARHADSGPPPRRQEADEAIREQVATLVRGWSLRDPNPTAYRSALERMASASPIFTAGLDERYRPEPRRVVEMALEANAIGEPVRRALDELAADGGLKWILETLEAAKASKTRDALWSHVATPEMIHRATRTEPFDPAILDLLLPRVGLAAAEPMLDTLAETDSSQARRVLLDRLVGLGDRVAPLALQRLDDKRWYVQRNMLKILGDLPTPAPGFKPTEYVKHQDHRVRREAMRILLKDPDERERAIAAALTDADERTVRLGLAAALDGCPPPLVPVVVARASSAASEDLRTLAIRVLGVSGHRSALEALLTIAAPRRRGLLGTKAPAKTPEYLAALEALHGFADDERAREVLALAARSRDREIVQAAAGSLREPR